MRFPLSKSSQNINFRFLIVSIMILMSVSGWVTASVYYSYPHDPILQTTSYELEAARFIDTTTPGSYIVISDEWMIYAGQAIVGVANPRAFYFSIEDPRLSELLNKMLANPSPEPLINAMETTYSSMGSTFYGATVAYFIVEKSRMVASEFDRVVQQASVTLRIYGIFGEGKLYIFYYERPS